MIDFRYHLVSLISVFLALAVGIILGAGPLQGALGETLTRQVDTLREERNDLRAELDDTASSLAADEAWLTAAAPRLLDGALTGRQVAVVSLGDVAPATRSGVSDQLAAAGADVVVTAKLPETWTDPAEESTQATVAEGLRGDLVDAGIDLPEDESMTTLGAAVTVALTGTTTDGARSGTAADLEQQLERFELLRLDDEQDTPADAVVLLTEALAEDDDATEPTASPTEEPVSPGHVGDVWTGAATGAALVTGSVVLSGPAAGGDDPVRRVRADDGLAAELTTVTDPTALASRITLPLALAAATGGVVDHYGPEPDTATIPPLPEG